MSEKETGLIERLAFDCGIIADGGYRRYGPTFNQLQAFAAALRAECEKESEVVVKIIRNAAGQIVMQGPDGSYFDMSKHIGTELYTRPQTDQATLEALEIAEKAMSAMLTHMDMDEDEFNKVTFDQMRAAIAAIQALKGQRNGS